MERNKDLWDSITYVLKYWADENGHKPIKLSRLTVLEPGDDGYGRLYAQLILDRSNFLCLASLEQLDRELQEVENHRRSLS